MTGVEMIAAERERQVNCEGWTAEHDDGHNVGELAVAAACYAAPFQLYQIGTDPQRTSVEFIDPWPLGDSWDKRHRTTCGIRADYREVPTAISTNVRIRELVKAGALIAAEIDRLQRANA